MVRNDNKIMIRFVFYIYTYIPFGDSLYKLICYFRKLIEYCICLKRLKLLPRFLIENATKN